MKIINLISLSIALGSLAVSIFVYFQSKRQFELANQPFVYINEALEEDKLLVSLQNIIGSDVLLIDQVKIGNWDLFHEFENDTYLFSVNENLKNRPVGPGENIDLLTLELKNPENLDDIPNKLPLFIQYQDRAKNIKSRSDEIKLFILKNALENTIIRRELYRVQNDFRIMLDRNPNIQVPDQIRRRMNTIDFNHFFPGEVN